MSQEILKPITNKTTKEELLQKLAEKRSVLHARAMDASARELFLTIEEYNGRQLICAPATDSVKIAKTGSILITASNAEERQFTMANYRFENNKVYLETKQTFFTVQKRANFRLALPPGLSAILKIETVAGEPMERAFEFDHLSGSGCTLTIPTGSLVEGVSFTGAIELPFTRILHLEGKVIRVVEGKRPDQQVAGVSFSAKNGKHNELAKCVSEIYRRFYVL